MSPIADRIAPAAAVPDPLDEWPVGIPHRGEFLTGSLGSVPDPRAVVAIANDRGCAHHDPGLRALAAALRREGFATLLTDVARRGETIQQRESGAVEARLHSVRAWLAGSRLAGARVVLLGLGAAATPALLFAAAAGADLAAVIACGPKPDAGGLALGMVSCPALLIAHTGQFSDLAAHVRALGRLGGRHDLAVLDDRADAHENALAIARAAAVFLAFIGPKDRKAA